MKLKPEYISHTIDDTHYLIGVGSSAFHGIVRSNETAAFIINRLDTETSPEAIVDALYEEYEAPREVLAADVEKVLSALRSINALEE